MQETEDIVPMPCPFCDDSDIYLDHDQGAWPMMRCQGCGATGPCVNTEPSLARKAWNTQPTIATLRAEVEGLRADAERWRAIRECRKTVQLYVYEDENDPCSGGWSYKNDPEDFDRFADAAIDAAKADKEGA